MMNVSFELHGNGEQDETDDGDRSFVAECSDIVELYVSWRQFDPKSLHELD